LAVNDVVNPNLDFKIYPNPVVDRISIAGDVSKAKSAKIYDLSGKLMKNIGNPFTNEKSIDVHSLLPNTYILNVDGKSIKFIKK